MTGSFRSLASLTQLLWISGMALSFLLPNAMGLLADEATIKGKIVKTDDRRVDIDFEELKLSLVEQISLKQVPVPEDWATKTNEERQAWFEAFNESDAGKKFQEQRREAIENQKRFDVELDEDGAYEIFDVPAGKYNLFGQLQKTVEKRNYLVEAYGQVEVEKDVEEIALDPLPLAITRILSKGEEAPNFEVDDFAGDKKFKLSEMSKNYVLINFWSIDNPTAKSTMLELAKADKALRDKIKLTLVSICVDEAPQSAKKFVSENDLSWFQGHSQGWDHESLVEYGIRAIPAFWLVDTEGKIMMTDEEFFAAFSQGNQSFESILEKRIPELGK